MNYLDRKPDKSKISKKVNDVISAYINENNDSQDPKCDPLGMYTGRPIDSNSLQTNSINADAINALQNGYKIHMRLDSYRRPDQDADDL